MRSTPLFWPALVAVASAAAVVPLWSSALLPFQDAPQHLASIRVLADYHTPEFGFEKWFEIDLFKLQYLGFYLPAAALAKVFGPDKGCRILLSLIGLALPASVWMLLGAFGRDRRLTVFAPAVFHTMPLYMGFFNYVESVPAAIAVVALTERQLREPSPRRAAIIGVGAALLLWLHPSALAFAIAAAVVLSLTSGLSARRMRAALLPYLPALALLCAWALRAALDRDGSGQAPHASPRWPPLRERVLDIARFGNVLAGHADELFVLALLVLFAAAVLVRGGERQERAFRLPLLAALTLVGYFVAPFDIGYMGFIEHRALPFLAVLIIASPALAPGRLTSALCAAAVALQLVYDAKLAVTYRAFDAEAQVAELHQVLAAAAPGKRLVALIWNQDSRVVQFQPYLHFGAYAEVQRGGRALYNFAETPWTPVRFRRGTEPSPMPRGWEVRPQEMDLSRVARETDTLLVRGPAQEPGAGFRLRARAGRWSLYETVQQ